LRSSSGCAGGTGGAGEASGARAGALVGVSAGAFAGALSCASAGAGYSEAEGEGTEVSMPGFSICMRNDTPMPSTSTAAMEAGTIQREAREGRAPTARRDAARIAVSSAAGGSSRASSR